MPPTDADEQVDLRRRGFVIVAHGGVGGVEQRAETDRIIGPQRLDRIEHALILGHDVTRPPRQDRRELFNPRERARVHVAQPFDAEERRRLERLTTAHGIFTARVRVGDARIDRDHLD
jgi:hypothetical protein